MGSHDFQVFCPRATEKNRTEPYYVRPADTAAEAYKNLVAAAIDEYGHDGYNGTISTTNGFRKDTPEVMTKRQAEKWANGRLALDEQPYSKWGEAGYIAIGEQPATEKTITMKALVSPVHAAPGEPGKPWTAQKEMPRDRALYEEALAPMLRIADGAELVNAKIVDDQREYKLKVTRNRGAATRVYIADRAGEFSSYDEACAAVTAQMEKSGAGFGAGQQRTRTEVIREEVRRGGKPLAEIAYTCVRREVTIEATIATPTGPVGDVIGWLFFGWAAS